MPSSSSSLASTCARGIVSAPPRLVLRRPPRLVPPRLVLRRPPRLVLRRPPRLVPPRLVPPRLVPPRLVLRRPPLLVLSCKRLYTPSALRTTPASSASALVPGVLVGAAGPISGTTSALWFRSLVPVNRLQVSNTSTDTRLARRVSAGQTLRRPGARFPSESVHWCHIRPSRCFRRLPLRRPWSSG